MVDISVVSILTGAFAVIAALVLPVLILVLWKRNYVYFSWAYKLHCEAEGEPPDRKRDLLERSCRWFERIRQNNLSEKMVDFHCYYWASSIRDLALLESDTDRKRALLKKACRTFEGATAKNTHPASICPELAHTQLCLADLEQVPEKRRKLLQSAHTNLEHTDGRNGLWLLRLKACVAIELASLAPEAEMQRALLKEAGVMYEALTVCDQSRTNNHNGYGWTLLQLADLEKESEAKRDLVQKALSAYKTSAIRYEDQAGQDDAGATACQGWGASLARLAVMAETPEEKRAMLEEAGRKYEQAAEYDEALALAWSGWGWTLLQLARLERDEAKRQALMQAATEKWLRAEDLEPGKTCYDLACIAALRRDNQACNAWLEQAERMDCLPSSLHIKDDPDLDNVHTAEWFGDLVARRRDRDREREREQE